MRKRRIYFALLILAVVGVLSLVVAGAFRERESEYGGKRLSEWVEMIGSMSSMRGYMAGNNEYRKAKEAVTQIGTNGVPFFVKWLSYEQPAWKIGLVRLTARFGSRGFVDRQAVLADGVKREMMLLVSFGNSGVPALLAVVTNRRAPAELRLRWAQYVPGYTNYTPEAVRALQELSTNWVVGGGRKHTAS